MASGISQVALDPVDNDMIYAPASNGGRWLLNSVKRYPSRTCMSPTEYFGGNACCCSTQFGRVRDVFEEAQAIITIHKNCKLMLLSVPSFQILVGLVLQRSANAEDDKIANKIERLVADTLNRSNNL